MPHRGRDRHALAGGLLRESLSGLGVHSTPQGARRVDAYYHLLVVRVCAGLCDLHRYDTSFHNANAAEGEHQGERASSAAMCAAIQPSRQAQAQS